MSLTATPVTFRTDRPGERVTLPRVIHSEWTKLWTLRSTRWSLLLAFVAQAGLGPLIALIEMARWSHLTLQDRLTINPIDHSLGGWHLAQLAVAILGVMTITGEYHTGMIRSSLMAAPKRLPVLWAKLLVFSAVVFVLMVIAAFIGFLGGQAIFTEHHVNVALSAPSALRCISEPRFSPRPPALCASRSARSCGARPAALRCSWASSSCSPDWSRSCRAPRPMPSTRICPRTRAEPWHRR